MLASAAASKRETAFDFARAHLTVDLATRPLNFDFSCSLVLNDHVARQRLHRLSYIEVLNGRYLKELNTVEFRESLTCFKLYSALVVCHITLGTYQDNTAVRASMLLNLPDPLVSSNKAGEVRD